MTDRGSLSRSAGMAIRKALAAPMRGFGVQKRPKRPITDADVERAIEEAAKDADPD